MLKLFRATAILEFNDEFFGFKKIEQYQKYQNQTNMLATPTECFLSLS